MWTIAPSTATSSACARNSVRSMRSSTRSRPSMVSDTVTANHRLKARRADRKPAEGRTAASRRGGWPLGSRLGRLIIILNFLGLAILVGGALVLNELRQGLVNARLEG